MAVAHRLGISLRFDFHGAAETAAFMCCHGVVTSFQVARSKRGQCRRCKRYGRERNDRASVLLDIASGIREG